MTAGNGKGTGDESAKFCRPDALVSTALPVGDSMTLDRENENVTRVTVILDLKLVQDPQRWEEGSQESKEYPPFYTDSTLPALLNLIVLLSESWCSQCHMEIFPTNHAYSTGCLTFVFRKCHCVAHRNENSLYVESVQNIEHCSGA